MKKLFFLLIISTPFAVDAQIDIDDEPKEVKKPATTISIAPADTLSYDMNDPYHHAVWRDVRSVQFRTLYEGESDIKVGYLFKVPIFKSSQGDWVTPDLQWSKSLMGYVMEADGIIKLVKLEFSLSGGYSNWEMFLEDAKEILHEDGRITYKYDFPYAIEVRKVYKKAWAGPRYIIQ